MVVKMMRWRPWPPLLSKKFQVKLIVLSLQGFNQSHLQQIEAEEKSLPKLTVEIRWKGPKMSLSSLRRKVKRNFTREEDVLRDGTVQWNEEFWSLCNLSSYKDNAAFFPWEISFTVSNGLNQGLKNKASIIGTASLNLAEFASAAEEKEIEINVPLSLPGGGPSESQPSICLALSLLELRTAPAQESSETVQRSILPVSLSPRAGDAPSTEKDEVSAFKAGLRKVKILTEYVSTRRHKKVCWEEEGSEGRCSARSEEAEYTYPFDTDSLDDFEGGETEGGKERSSFRKSFSYGTLASANCAGGSCYSEMRINGEDEAWIYYSNRKSDVGCVHVEETTSSISEQSVFQTSKRSILPWKKRKLGFRSPKAKGEPLLKKAYGEEGGDDIDFDRRQLSSSDESFAIGWHKTDDDASANRSSASEFGDDNFAVGNWEQKELVSRDGHMKLSTQVFFASIDQRSERAAGESACTALVAVIADWFQTNQDTMPIKSQFDSLIREGSLEWRNLCENETYRERFPDKHFDLETVLQAKIRPLAVVPEKSFIGFFHPDGMGDGFDFLHGAMSFDGIWDEISRTGSSCPSESRPQLYIVSWNDHFFVLKVEPEAYYIIDTLGERLYEGCNQAYVLKFDRDTSIYRLSTEGRNEEKEKPTSNQDSGNLPAQQNNLKEGVLVTKPEDPGNQNPVEEVVCRGKEACKEYIKRFLAAIPIRELQVDIKKGLMASTPLHHRLQIEFHLTEFCQLMITPTSPAAMTAD
ncbi:uncharacterized protein LOC143859118 [Tasmannia lanceolata]|uniref:uncharacterized protein LOC143859118 n=1 Tax=Tasmannia lanceolata TaxID=3420 RepID=UPI0040645580